MERINSAEQFMRGKELLTIAEECWNDGAEFRRKRSRCRDYTFGRQWNDIIEYGGRKMTEYEYIVNEGNIPLKNNLIRRMVRNVLGVFRRKLGEEMEGWDKESKALAAANNMYELYSRSMEEFLISGMVIHRKWFGMRGGAPGVWTEPVSPSSFFYNSDAHDVRGWDLDIAGQFHDLDFGAWCDAFVKSTDEYAEACRLFPRGKGVRRVVELWRRERLPRKLLYSPAESVVRIVDVNKEVPKGCRGRWYLDNVWRYYFIDESGAIIREGDTPYRHGGSPFVVKCYPYMEGEVQSFVGDIIDQQRYTNRLITLYDWVIRASAKGVLLMPESAVEPEALQDAADQWSRFNGIIVYRPKPGVPDPRQINGNTSNSGISELLNIQLKMLEDVSGVNGALQGNVATNSVSGTLYNQQTENAMTSLIDILDTFASFISECRKMERSLVAQCRGFAHEN